jgi:uncharacterized OsmC-like protein
MKIDVSFPGEKLVAVQIGRHSITTDQATELGRNDSAPAPFDLFLASVAACAGIYVLAFLQARKLSTEGLVLTQHVVFNAETLLPSKFRIELTLPRDLPEKYRAAVVRAAENCKVKKTMLAMPEIEVVAVD